jgi:hypothetical protein
MDKKYICNTCDYQTNYPSEWLKHIETNKHKKQGVKTPPKCDLCDYEAASHWNIKMHKLTQHSSIEEREKQKYYCKSCDQVFFCQLYYDTHMRSKKHKNIIQIKEYDEQNI